MSRLHTVTKFGTLRTEHVILKLNTVFVYVLFLYLLHMLILSSEVLLS